MSWNTGTGEHFIASSPALGPAPQLSPMGIMNVKDPAYAGGAKFDGVTNDSAALNSAYGFSPNAPRDGIVWHPPGVAILNSTARTPNTANFMILQGSGRGATVIKGNGGALNPVLWFLCNGHVADMTVDGAANAITALQFGNLSGQASLIFDQACYRVTAQNVTAVGGWVLVCWDMNQTFQVASFIMQDVIVAGPSNAAGDAFAISYVDLAVVRGLIFRALARSPNFFVINKLVANGIYSDGAASYASIVFDQGVLVADLSDIIVNSTLARSAAIIVNCPLVAMSNVQANQNGGLKLNAAASGPMTVSLTNPDLSNGIEIDSPITELRVSGGRVFGKGQGSAVVDVSASGTTGLVSFNNVHCDGAPAALQVFRASNAVTWTYLICTDCRLTGFSAPVDTAHITVTHLRLDNPVGYNPASRQVVAGASPYTYTNADGYEETIMLTTVGGLTALTYKGTAGASIAAGIPFVLKPEDAMIFTWATTAPVFQVLPLTGG